MAKFQAPEGTTSISVGGAQYNTDADGNITAPDNLAPLLLPCGFRLVDEPTAAADDPPAADPPPGDAVADSTARPAAKGGRKADSRSGAD